MLFNNTSKSISHPSESGFGVVLPQSDKILYMSDIDSKIEKTKNHIDHLSNAQAHRTTHGGKRFRARQTSLRDQIAIASKRLELLTSAKETIFKRAGNRAKNNPPFYSPLTYSSLYEHNSNLTSCTNHFVAEHVNTTANTVTNVVNNIFRNNLNPTIQAPKKHVEVKSSQSSYLNGKKISYITSSIVPSYFGNLF